MNEFASIKNATVSLPRKTAFWAGLFYALTFISIPTLFLYSPIHQSTYVFGESNDNNVVIGGLLEIAVALFGIVTSVILYSVLKKQNETLAIGLIAGRVLEAATMFVGVAFLLGAVSLHHQTTDTASATLANTLVVMYDRIFILGQGFMPGIDDLLLGTLLYKSRLVPRGLALVGIIGAFVLFAGYFAIMFGYIDRFSVFSGASALMVAVFEFSVGIYLLIKGLKKQTHSFKEYGIE